MDRTPATHDAEENGAAWADHGQQFIEGLSCPFKDVAQGTAQGGYDIERRWFEAREIGDIESLSSLNGILVPCGNDAIAVEVKLTRRDIADEYASAEPSQLDGEAPGAGADLEHAVALMDPTTLKAFMKLETYAARNVSLEAIPLGRAVLVVEDPYAVGGVTAGHDV
jgi:hypothetical protein